MVKQYEHFLYRYVLGGDSVQDADGNWVTSAPGWVFHSNCREETNGKGTTIQGTDGKATLFSSLVLLPKGALKIAEGTAVKVCNAKDPNSETRIEKPVLKCDISKLHGRLWL